MSITLKTIALNKLERSRNNARKTGGQSIEELAASIAAHGLLQSLVVAAGAKSKFTVVAGARRLAALQVLAKAKRIPKTYPVPCRVIEAEASTEASLAENVIREAMHPADQFEAFRGLVDQGSSIDEIAARFGVSALTVEKRLKLANVSPRLLDLYRQDELTLDHLMALAITEDHEAQERAWFETPEWNRNPRALRRLLTDAEIDAGSDRRAQFVGVEAYEAAGGTIRRDLFAEDHEGYIADVSLLERLAMEKLEAEAATISAEGWSWVLPRLSLEHAELAAFGRVYPSPRPLDGTEQGELDRLTAEYEELAEQEDDDPEGTIGARLDQIDVRLDELRTRAEEWPSDVLGIAGAVVTINSSGELRIERGLIRPEDKRVVRQIERSADSSDIRAGAAEAPKREIPDRLMEDLTAHRTAALGAVLMDRPEIALVAITHSMAVQVLYGHTGFDKPTALQVQADRSADHVKRAAEGIEESAAYSAIQDRHGWWMHRVPAESHELWGWLLRQEQETVLRLLGFCTAQTVNAVRTPQNERHHQHRLTAADDLAEAVGLDMADWWTATRASYLGRVSKARVLDAVREAVTPEAADNLSKMKKDALVAEAERRLEGRRWLPAALRRAAEAEAQAPVAFAEAAE